ncbi:MAG: DNA-formamidopyrimidine glycosylase [Candidatus Nomurabacteria bacterium]|jgi:formamidopyrimidine-DNA glycosylase|nr:DNA-formamidopyrimidine glycosylase [Candidatus Nomurabacteria bacterium]
MPELPEVETIKRGLLRLIVGKKIKKIEVENAGSFLCLDAKFSREIIGHEVVGVRRRAKVLIIDFVGGLSLVFHLKMTGQIIFRSGGGSLRNDGILVDEKGFAGGHPTKSMERELPDKSTRVWFDFGDGKLFFNDERKFGWVRLMKTAAIGEIAFMKKLGPDFNAEDLRFEIFVERILRHGKSKIKNALLDQTTVAGLGNIYVDETLNMARVNPLRLVSDLSSSELLAIFSSARKILARSIELNGSSWRNYRDASGERGSYLDEALVYARAGQACRFCGAIIEKIKVNGRGTSFCPKCQA